MKIINSEPLLPLLNSLPSLGLAKLIGLTGLFRSQIGAIASQSPPRRDVVKREPRKTDKPEARDRSFQLQKGDIITTITAIAIRAVGMSMSDDSFNIAGLYIVTY